MFLDNLHFWASIAFFCAFALFVEGVLLVRILFLTHQRLRKYLLAMFPLLVSIWSFIVVLNALNVPPPYWTSLHFSPVLYHMLVTFITQATFVCQILTGIMLIVFIVVLLIEKETLPHVSRPPVWVMRKSSSLY